MNNNITKKLDEAMKFVNETKVNIDYNNVNLEDILQTELTSDNNDTISLFYREDIESIILTISGKNPNVIVKESTPEDYLDLCKTLNIEENDDYNVSNNIISEGVHIRVFAITRPLSKYPNITISTAKQAPATWEQVEVINMLDKIVKNNFIIIGASGAGKTYLLNYMLSRYHKDTNRKIGIVGEFSEIFPPNLSTFSLVVPTTKPEDKMLLKFITEQSNLMRLDYLYVEEVKSSEAYPFVMNLASGTRGATTVHGSSIAQGLKRLQYLCTSTGSNQEAVDEAISKSIKSVIYIKDHEIRHIAELSGVHNNGVFQMKTIFQK